MTNEETQPQQSQDLQVNGVNRNEYNCYLCGSPYDENKACTDPSCPLYGISRV